MALYLRYLKHSLKPFSQKQFLSEAFQLQKVEMTDAVFRQHRTDLMGMLVSQFARKDPASSCLSQKNLYQDFDFEYSNIFSTRQDKSYRKGFLFFDQNNSLSGHIMYKDAYLTSGFYENCLRNMKPEDPFYDFTVALVKNMKSFISMYGIKENDAFYVTNLAFSEQFLENYKGKQVLDLIYAFFLDVNLTWRQCMPDCRYGAWVQMRKSLISNSLKVFNVQENRDFAHLADNGEIVKGKFIIAKKKENIELKTLLGRMYSESVNNRLKWL